MCSWFYLCASMLFIPCTSNWHCFFFNFGIASKMCAQMHVYQACQRQKIFLWIQLFSYFLKIICWFEAAPYPMVWSTFMSIKNLSHIQTHTFIFCIWWHWIRIFWGSNKCCVENDFDSSSSAQWFPQCKMHPPTAPWHRNYANQVKCYQHTLWNTQMHSDRNAFDEMQLKCTRIEMD